MNDYTMSAHSVFSLLFGKEAIITKVFIYRSLSIDNVEEIVNDIMKLFDVNNEFIQETELKTFDDNWEYRLNDSVMQKIIPIVIDDNKFVLELLSDYESLSVVILSNAVNEGIYNYFTESIKKFKKPITEIKGNTFFTITACSYGGFDLENLSIKNDLLSLDDLYDNYNEDFIKADEIIKEAISENYKGLILLHGIPGSGKTSYIKHLITHGSKRKIVYIPTHLTGSISSPEFISFVKEKLTNSVLVIEDAEQVLITRDDIESHKAAVSNILNMTDGILADALNLLIIGTFNTDMENIDEALLRKGRLKLQYKFDNLTTEKTNYLTNKLYGKTVDKAMTLADIYNLEYELIVPKKRVDRKIGYY